MTDRSPGRRFLVRVTFTAAAAAMLAAGAPASDPPRGGGVGNGPGGEPGPSSALPLPCARTIVADVVALDQVLIWNKFGSMDPYGQIYALRRDVVSASGANDPSPGDAMLRPDLRPRPLTLRVAVGDCLQVRFTNLLDPNQFAADTPATRTASFQVLGLPFVDIDSAASAVGRNPSSLAAPGQTRVYTYLADAEGVHLARSMGALAGGEGDGGSLSHGLFGAVVVEPAGSLWLDSSTGEPLLDGNAIVSGTPYAIVHGFADPGDGIEATPEGAFREFVVLFHDEAKTVHANPRLENEFWLHSVRDAFGINYGISGIGQILLDALCVPDCRYEEAFLTSWANGDPALLPHFGSDPSNVWHSYLGDRVVIRNLHAGPKETHLFHLHAHQWLYSPENENSSYLDSQAIGPGSAFTLDVTFGGSGNRNLTVGDAIFHCHLYPHFAQGMWGLWRVHDVYEDGTRTLPDGTPIPRVAPIPGNALPPLPSVDLPGYPFFIPGAAGSWPVAGFPGDFKPGHRPPQPPLDMVADGGLPRHVIVDGEKQGTLLNAGFVPGSMPDFDVVPPGGDPDFAGVDYVILPQAGTRLEQSAMAFHASRQQATGIWGGIASIVWQQPTVDPTPLDYSGGNGARPGVFRLNGQAAAPGAPFANPCPPGVPVRRYSVSAIDLDMQVNNTGWHDPQGRINVLDGDVAATIAGTRATEPFFFRANSNDCIVFEHTNRTAREMHQDDFQVQTPTDTIGQHIHLVKFDVTASDGSGNGWNYEDGTFSAEEIHNRLAGMGFSGAHPESATGGGFQTTVQRWWADPLLNSSGEDRTVRTVFTHDHFAPSTIQPHGFYNALVVEPAGSTWWDSETGRQLGTRQDGGPTSWRADIRVGREGIREFCLAVADFGIVYDERDNPINPPRDELGVITPEAIAAADPGTFLMNYRNEPVPLRLGVIPPTGSAFTNQLRRGNAGRVPYVFDSRVHGDPATPLLTAFEGDNVQIRLMDGANEDSHGFKIERARWLREPSEPTSGLINGQHIGISEHFEMDFKAIFREPGEEGSVDLLWSDGTEDGLWNGAWGLMRVHGEYECEPGAPPPPRLQHLPNNRRELEFENEDAFDWPCPRSAPVRTYDVVAVAARDVIGPDGIVYNRTAGIIDDTGLMFVLAEDLDGATGRLRGDPAPLVLRANAGDCLKIRLTNRLPSYRQQMPDNPASDAPMPPIVDLNVQDLRTDNLIGWSVDLVYGDADQDGARVGYNAKRLVEPGRSKTFTYYCGELLHDARRERVNAVPRAFGVCGVRPMGDLIKQGAQGLVAAVVVEPEGSTWVDPRTMQSAGSGLEAIVTCPPATCGSLPTQFHEFVVVQQDGLNLHQGRGNPIPDVADDAEDAGEKAFNYRTAPFWEQLGGGILTPAELNDVDLSGALAGNTEAQVFVAQRGEHLVFRLTQPVGRGRAHTFAIQGHTWLDEPDNPTSNVQGQQTAHIAGCNWNLVLREPAGGPHGVAGDYLFQEVSSFQFSQGAWGILRVQ